MSRIAITNSRPLVIVSIVIGVIGAAMWLFNQHRKNALLDRMSYLVNSEFERGLPGGYRIFASNPYTVAILPPESMSRHPSNCGSAVAIAARVTEIGTSGNIIFGKVTESPKSELASIESPGFFVIDSSTGHVSKGLTIDELYKVLDERGISAPEFSNPKPD